jgi:hypothetical protein
MSHDNPRSNHICNCGWVCDLFSGGLPQSWSMTDQPLLWLETAVSSQQTCCEDPYIPLLDMVSNKSY